MGDNFDPYYKWLGIPRKDQPPHFYRLLGVEAFEQDDEVIEAAANRLMSYLRDLSAGTQAEAAQRLLNEVAQARIVLLNAGKRRAYDQELRASLGPPSAVALPPDVKAPPAPSHAAPIQVASSSGHETPHEPSHARFHQSRQPGSGPRSRGGQRNFVVALIVLCLVLVGGLAGAALWIMPGLSGHATPAAEAGAEIPERSDEQADDSSISSRLAEAQPGAKAATEDSLLKPERRLVVQWPEPERPQGTVRLNELPGQLPRQGPVEFLLLPGVHQLVLTRPGFRRIEAEIDLTTETQIVFQPKWESIEAEASPSDEPFDLDKNRPRPELPVEPKNKQAAQQPPAAAAKSATKSNPSKAKQAKTKQAKTKQAKTKQAKTKQAKRETVNQATQPQAKPDPFLEFWGSIPQRIKLPDVDTAAARGQKIIPKRCPNPEQLQLELLGGDQVFGLTQFQLISLPGQSWEVVQADAVENRVARFRLQDGFLEFAWIGGPHSLGRRLSNCTLRIRRGELQRDVPLRPVAQNLHLGLLTDGTGVVETTYDQVEDLPDPDVIELHITELGQAGQRIRAVRDVVVRAEGAETFSFEPQAEDPVRFQVEFRARPSKSQLIVQVNLMFRTWEGEWLAYRPDTFARESRRVAQLKALQGKEASPRVTRFETHLASARRAAQSSLQFAFQLNVRYEDQVFELARTQRFRSPAAKGKASRK